MIIIERSSNESNRWHVDSIAVGKHTRRNWNPMRSAAIACLMSVFVSCGCNSSETQTNDSSNAVNEDVTGGDRADASLSPNELSGLDGRWDGVLGSPGGELRFGLTLSVDGQDVSAVVHNGPESIPIPEVDVAQGNVVMRFPHYDSVISASLEQAGVLSGNWRKRSTNDQWTEMTFLATKRPAEYSASTFSFDQYFGRWKAQFDSSDDPAIAVFSEFAPNQFMGTFLTTVGDYRYLSGWIEDEQLWMSCFDGAHAFLFRAKIIPDDTLEGDFWSRDSWHETWTAQRDDEATLRDAFELTSANVDVDMGSLEYPDLDGTVYSLGDEQFQGKVRLLHIFGSWCPNCHDAGELIAALLNEYRDRGLVVQGLAFELTGDHSRDAEQVRRYLERHDVRYPVLLAGLADKEKASEAFPLIDRVRSYPTTIFLDQENQIRAIHTGFSGPATGRSYELLVERFHSEIESILADE